MTQEEKQLLLVDLCARLPYHPHIWITNHLTNIELTPDSEVYQYVMCETSCKPYLRPMSSMTEDEEEEYNTLLYGICDFTQDASRLTPITELTTFFHSHHFDYRGLIPMGLALEAPKDMYKIE